MPRPERNRRISCPPAMKGFKPFGIPRCKIERLRLHFEEYESLRLVNYEMLSQDQAALQMNVSRPTLTRIYNRALKVISKALIEGKAIVIEGGSYELVSDWYRCKKCHRLIEGIHNHSKCENCNDYSTDELVSLNR